MGRRAGTMLIEMMSLLPFFRCKLCKGYIAASEHMHILQGDDFLFSLYPRNHYYKCTDTGVEWQLKEEESPRVIFHQNKVFFDVKLNCVQCERHGFGQNLLGQSFIS